MSSNRFSPIVAAVAVLAVAACSEPIEPPAPATPPTAAIAAARPTRAATRKSEKIPGEWIIQFKQGTANPRGLMLSLLAQENATLKSEHLDIAGAFIARISDARAAALRNHPAVRTVEQNMTAVPTTTQSPAPWGLDRIDQRNRPMNGAFTYAWTGSGVHIYMMDSGIDPDNSDLGGRVSGGVSVVGDNLGTLDGCGHGTGTAGVAAGSTYGVAKAAYLHPVKVLDRYCGGDVSAFIYGLDWIKNNRSSPAITNASIGFGGIVSAVDSAVTALINSGVPFVTAAGNDYYLACEYTPGRVPGAITVAATDSFDVKAGFSNSGSCVDIFAPGIDILTDYYDYWSDPGNHSGTAWYTGTSVAAPFVTGAAAIILQQSPSASPASVASTLSAQASSVVQYPGLNTTNKLVYVPHTLSVSVNGRSIVRPNQPCSWTASTSGGVGSITYTWYVNGWWVQSGTSNELIYTLTSSSTITVYASDAEGATGNGSKYVTTSTSTTMCAY